MRQFGVAVPGRVAHLRLGVNALRDPINWLVITRRSNACNAVNGTAVLQEVVNLVAAFTPACGELLWCETQLTCFFEDGLRGRPGRSRTGSSSEGFMGPAMSCLALRMELECFREGFKGETVESFSQPYGVYVNPVKTVVPPSKGHTPTAEKMSLLRSFDVRIAEEGGMATVEVPIGTAEEHVIERAVGVVRESAARTTRGAA